jgi:Putative Ig domain
MDRAASFTHGNLRQLFIFALAGCALLGALNSARAAAADGLAISGHPIHNATEGLRWSFTPTVADPSKRSLSFRIANQPPWATFSKSTGQLAGTPPLADVGRTYNVTITVLDGFDQASLWFQIVVGADTPVISGTPPKTAVTGTAYSFQPTATDPLGKPLSFSVRNKPAWAAFSIATGRLYGTPSSGQVGTYSGVTIVASNYQHSAALPYFSITVTNATGSTTGGSTTGGSTTGGSTTRSAKVTWEMPTHNTNGSVLTNLAGATIYYGTSASALTKSVRVNNASATSYTISGLTAGTWYFGVKAYTGGGETSAMSKLLSAAIK